MHSNSVRIAWDPPKDLGGGDVEDYILECCSGTGADGGQWATIYAGGEREFNATGLEAGQTYSFRVSCQCTGGQSGCSDVLQVTTLPVAPGACAAPTLHSKPKPNSLHIRWAPPDYLGGSEITDYEVQMIEPDGTVRAVSHGLRPDCAVANLLPGRQYQFRVRAHNKAGQGPWSESLDAQTGAGPPDPPTDVTCTARSPHCVHLVWSEPAANGAPITEYRVQQATRR